MHILKELMLQTLAARDLGTPETTPIAFNQIPAIFCESKIPSDEDMIREQSMQFFRYLEQLIPMWNLISEKLLARIRMIFVNVSVDVLPLRHYLTRFLVDKGKNAAS